MSYHYNRLLAVIILLPALLFAQSVKDHPRVQEAADLIEIWIDAQHDYDQIPGISMGIVYKDELVFEHAFGVSDLEKQSPMTTETIYSICSISKLFTSIALMQLRDKGLLRLDDPVGKHLSWFEIGQLYPDGPPITIESMLTHSSGLPRESDYPYWNAPNFEFPCQDDIINQIKNQKTLYPASTYYQYSNLGLTLAGEIVEAVSGKPFEEYVIENIIKPLELSNTRPEMPEDLVGGQLATGYSAVTRSGKREKMPFFQANGITPAAGFSSTMPDLIKFAKWQLRLLDEGGSEVLAVNTLREMQRVHWLDPNWKTTRGLGFGVYRNSDITFVGHEGSCPGYRSALMIQTKSEVASVFMANANGVNTGKYAQNAYRIISPAIETAVGSDSYEDNFDPAFEKYLGIYEYFPWGGEIAVIKWEGKLAMVYFPTTFPLDDLEELEHVEGHTFSRVRSDGAPGDEIIFKIGDNGNVESMFEHSNYWPKFR
jgi:CubicO group peptidase (beta-lactamase class C family)